MSDVPSDCAKRLNLREQIGLEAEVANARERFPEPVLAAAASGGCVAGVIPATLRGLGLH